MGADNSPGLRNRTELRCDSMAKNLVLVPSPRQLTGGPLNDTTSSDSLAATELLAGQVHLDRVGQPVPPVIALLFTVEVCFAEHEVTAEYVVHD